MGITDTQSYGWVIRNAFYDTLAADSFFANHFKRKTKMVPIMANQLPYLGVYIIDEQMIPDGDANAGGVSFSHTLRIGFSVMLVMNDQDQAEAGIDAAFWKIMNLLWTNTGLLNVMNSTMPDNTRIESTIRGVRRQAFGHAQLTNQTPLAELQYDVSVFYRTYWEPVIPDTLDEVDVTVQMNADTSFKQVYTFDQSRKDRKHG